MGPTDFKIRGRRVNATVFAVGCLLYAAYGLAGGIAGIATAYLAGWELHYGFVAGQLVWEALTAMLRVRR